MSEFFGFTVTVI